MSKTRDELHQFVAFARKWLDGEGAELSLDELFDLWRSENPADFDYTEDVIAVKAALHDLQNGDRGTPAGEHSDVLRSEFGITL